MKIGTSEIYDDFIKHNYETKVALTNDIELYSKSKNYLLDKIIPHKHYINNFTNIDFDGIPTLTKNIPPKAIKTFVSVPGLSTESLKSNISAIVEINKTLNKSQEQLNVIEDCDVSKDIFKEILYKFNTKVSDKIIYKGYTFKLGFGIGDVRIKKVRTDKRKKKRINWDESNKLKKELIANNKIPFKVLERDENGRPIKDNGGEMWFVYFNTDFDYLWNWTKKTANALNVPYYKFKPTKYNNTSKGGKLGNINKLKQLVTSNSPLLDNFTLNEYI